MIKDVPKTRLFILHRRFFLELLFERFKMVTDRQGQRVFFLCVCVFLLFSHHLNNI